MLIVHLRLPRDGPTPTAYRFTVPGHEKQSISIWVLQAYKSSTPTFICGRVNLYLLCSQPIMKFIHFGDTENEVHTTASLEHCFDLLNQRNSQRPRPQRSNW